MLIKKNTFIVRYSLYTFFMKFGFLVKKLTFLSNSAKFKSINVFVRKMSIEKHALVDQIPLRETITAINMFYVLYGPYTHRRELKGFLCFEIYWQNSSNQSGHTTQIRTHPIATQQGHIKCRNHVTISAVPKQEAIPKESGKKTLNNVEIYGDQKCTKCGNGWIEICLYDCLQHPKIVSKLKQETFLPKIWLQYMTYDKGRVLHL